MQLSHEFQNALNDFYALSMTKDNYAERLEKAYNYIYSLKNKKVYNLTDKEYEYIINKYRAFTFEIINGFRHNKIKYYSLNNKDFTKSRINSYAFYYINHSKETLHKGYWAKRVHRLIKHNKYKYHPNKDISIKISEDKLKDLRFNLFCNMYQEIKMRK